MRGQVSKQAHQKSTNTSSSTSTNKHIDKKKNQFINEYILQPSTQVPPQRHSHAILTLPLHCLHAAATSPHTAASCSHAVVMQLPHRPMQPQRCCKATSTQPLHHNNASPAPQQRSPHYAACSPHTTSALLNAALTLPQRCSHAD